MRKHLLTTIMVLAAIVILTNTANAQLHVAFAELREFPEDSLAFEKLEKLFSENKVEEARTFGSQKADSCMQAGNIHDYLFFMNQTGAFTIFVGRDLEKAFSTFYTIDSVMQGRADTMSIEFVITQKFLATTYYYQYKDKKANKHYRRGLNILEEMGITDNTLAADFYVNVGNTYTNMGQYENALPFIRKGRKLTKEKGYYHLLMLANQSFGYIASFRDSQLAFEFYEHIYEEAERLSETLPESPAEKATFLKYMANIDNVVTNLYRIEGDYDKALFHAKRAYEVFTTANLPDLYLKILVTNGIAKLYLLKEQPEKATNYITESLQIVDSSFGRKDHRAVKVLNTALQHGLQTGNYDTAAYYADAMNQVNYPPGIRTEKITHYLAMADYHKAVDSIEQAANYYEKGIRLYAPEFDITRLRDSIPDIDVSYEEYFRNLHKVLADFEETFDQLQFADEPAKDFRIKLEYYDLMTSLLDKHASGIIVEQSGMAYSKKYEHTANRQIETATTLYELTNKSDDLQKLFSAIARTKSFFLQKQMANNHMNAQKAQKSDAWKSYMKKLQQLQQLENQQMVTNLADSSRQADSLENAMLDVKFALLEQQMEFENNTTNELPEIRQYDMAQIQSLIKEDEALLNYYMTDSSLLALCITHDDMAFARTGQIQALESSIRSYYRAIKTGDHQLKEKANELSQYILRPFEEMIAGKEHLVMIPHKTLFKVPMEPLRLANGKMLVEEKSISYHYASSLWAAARERESGQRGEFLAFAPVFSKKQQDEELAYRSMLEEAFIEKYYRSGKQQLDALTHSVEEVKSLDKAFS
ncbi:MAG: CHAT domain-containing protein, partial [Bacteroidales bacterium]|nr:CHAT domain-containing protein [Bacteroidales bacterium]